ncbi:MAG TPA: GNAT family N-acetyltransferase [Acidimicrobiia bacterium]|jgi:predicted acetyltransferase
MTPHPVRPVTRDEFDRFANAEFSAFGEHVPSEEHPAWATAELDRTLAAFDGEEVVGTGRIYSLELTLPGGRTVPTAAVSAIGVLPTHRRRGILTSIMGRQLDDAAERGETTATLTASEGTIYRRFGYGVATLHQSFELDTGHAAFLPDVAIEGRCRLIDEDAATKTLPGIFDRSRRVQPGAISRTDAWWPSSYFDFDEAKVGAGKSFHAVYESPAGELAGYATYAIQQRFDSGIARNRLGVREVSSVTPQARRALWRFLCDIDLVETITAWNAPVDEPLRWMLRDSRRLEVRRLGDHLWVRLVDVETALAERTYASTGDLVIEVRDGFRPASAGRYRLSAGDDGSARCSRTDDEADVALDTADLASAFLGGVRFGDLARAGLVEERTAGSVARLHTMFAVDPLPYSQTWF